MTAESERLIWIDLEMTGLEPDTDDILEIACLVTDGELNVLAEGPELAIHHEDTRLQQMDDWNRKQHASSGLWQRAVASSIDMAEAERQTLAFLREWVPAGTSPMCGNSVSQDRRFLLKYMPALEAHFHYRHLDVSTIKILAKMWAPGVAAGLSKQSAHTALSDIRESVAELAYYRQFMGELAGVTPAQP